MQVLMGVSNLVLSGKGHQVPRTLGLHGGHAHTHGSQTSPSGSKMELDNPFTKILHFLSENAPSPNPKS